MLTSTVWQGSLEGNDSSCPDRAWRWVGALILRRRKVGMASSHSQNQEGRG